MSTDDQTATDEMKRKFKEALDKKNAHHRSGEAHLDGDATRDPRGAHAAPRSRRAVRAFASSARAMIAATRAITSAEGSNGMP